MVAILTKPLTVRVTDASRQNLFLARDISPDSTVGELITSLPSRMGLVDKANSKPIAYTARLDGEGRQLNASERVGDVLREDDRLTMAPSIDAG